MTDLPTTDVRWDLSDLFDSLDDPRIDAGIAALQERVRLFAETYKGRINSPGLDAATLLAALREFEAIEQESSKPGDYAGLMFATDTSDPARGAFLQRMREELTALSLPMLFFTIELAEVAEEIIAPLRETAEVRGYRHYIDTVRLYKDHMLSEPEERLLEETANTGTRAWDRLFDEITANTVFRIGDTQLTQSEVLSRLYEPDREVRRTAAASFSEGLRSNSRTVSFIFNTLLQDKNMRDRVRRYTYPEQSRHLANELSRQTVDLVVDTVHRNYAVVSRYYKVKAQILGVDTLTHYDRYAPLFSAESEIGFSAARAIVLDAFGKFSPVMREHAAAFFANGWIDAAPVKGKQGGAFCSYTTPDLHPYVLLNYLGRMKDVMTLAHELGHGVHASLSREQSLLNFHGTLPLAELASTFGETLVFEKVQAQASLKDRLALYAEKIEGTFATISRQAAMFRFEQAIHNHRRTRGELTIEDFGDYWQREIQLMFGDSLTLGEEHRLWWSYIGHFTGTPFYVYAYSFGELLVLSLYRRSQSEGAEFVGKYLRMLRAGGSLTPSELVAIVDVDLDDPAFWQGGLDVLAEMVDRFDSLWAEYRPLRNSGEEKKIPRM
ncbi:MAG: M3 family oligoendopeptidase [Capsulimonadaceae bacterium]